MPGARDPGQAATGLKASKYNVSVSEGAGSYLLANTLTTAVVRLRDPSPLQPARAALLEGDAPFDLPLDETTLDLLVSNGFLVSEDFDEMEWLERLHWTARRGREALGVGVAVTLGCNFRCTYCYQRHERVHLPLELEESIVKFVAKGLEGRSVLRVMWFGGEPLLRTGAIRRISRSLLGLTDAQGVRYDGSITTNGYLLSEETSRMLVDLGVTDVQVTLDGPPAIHDERRPLANGRPTFDVILRNLVAVAKLFSRVIVRINVDRRNQAGMPELLDLLRPVREWVELAFRPATSPDSPPQEEAWCIPSTAYWDLDKDLALLAKELGFRIIRGYAFPGTSFCSGYQLNSVTIDPYGDVHRCPVCVGRRDRRFGVLTAEGAIRAQDGMQKQWDQWSPFLDHECRECKALPVCMGGCLWYVGREKAGSLRCFAKQRLTEGMLGESLFGGGIRATERAERR